MAQSFVVGVAYGGSMVLVSSAAATYAPKGIRVNCLAPGLTRTPLTARLCQHEAAAKASASLHALGRIGTPEEIASAIDWLLDTEQAWITGQVLGVDGGLSRVRSRS